MMRNPMNEDAMDMKIESGSVTRMKSSPRARGYLEMVSPPPRATGMRVSGSTAVTAPSRTAQRERTDLDIRLARGMVKAPRIGTRTVRRVIVSVFMREVIY